MRKRKIQKLKEERNREVFQQQKEAKDREGEGKTEAKEEEHYQNIFRTFAEGQAASKLEDGNDSGEEEEGNKTPAE